MNTLVKKYERLATLCSVGVVILLAVMMMSCQYLEREDTVVAAFVVVSISTMGTFFLLWRRAEYKSALKSIGRF